MKIFLSHRSEHQQLVREFKRGLPAFINTWLDEDALTWGDALETEIRSAIQSDVDFVIIFLDADALESEWVKKELDWAFAREKELSRTFVLPIILPDTPRERLPPALAKRLQLVVQNHADDVTELARRASERLFHLVIKTLATLEKKRPFRPTTFDFLQGDWHECHFIYRRGEAQPVREQWHIREHEVRSASDSGLTYSGVIGEDDWTLVALFEGVGHREVVVCRLYKPIPSSNFTVRGMWFAVDHDKYIACGPEIVTRDQLDDDSARQLLQTSVEMHVELPLMKLLPYGPDVSTIDKA